MPPVTVQLLGARRFAPLFATQFLGAFNDNLYRTAMTFLIVYHLKASDPQAGAVLATAAAGLFILPYFLFSALAGQLADVRDKAWVARAVKVAEVAIMAVGAFALTHDSIALLMFILFCMGVHSAFFGPMKYSILPQHLGRQELLAGTGLVEAGTFLAILFGQILGGLFTPVQAAWGVVLVAVLGLAASWPIPPAPPLVENGRLSWNLAAETVKLMKTARANRTVWRSILALSWFWALGTVMTAQLGPLVKTELGASQAVATLCLAAFSVGIAVGSVLIGRLLRGRVTGRYCAASMAVVALALFDLVLAVDAFGPVQAGALSPAAFLASLGAWRVLVDLTVLAIAGGAYSVPLYALMQTASAEGARSRMVAANNVLNAVWMVAATGVSAALLGAGLRVTHICLVLAGFSLVMAAYCWRGLRE